MAIMKNLNNVRVESDLIGSLEVPADALYGVQTLRGIENFPISNFHLNDYPLFINGLAMTKLAAAEANYQLGLLNDAQYKGITQACREILEGKISTKGKLTSLLELGAGFHPDFSGRENIYFNASIFGLTRKEIDNRLNDIIEFSELEIVTLASPTFLPNNFPSLLTVTISSSSE